MPNFTEGEWYSEDGFIFSKQINKNVMIADFVPLESDARLMAQSKRMYEVLKDLAEHFGWGYENRQLVMEGRYFELSRIAAILSEIDKE